LKKLLCVVLMGALMTLQLASCGAPASTENSSHTAKSTDNSVSPIVPAGQAAAKKADDDSPPAIYPITVEDDLARKITINKMPIRIVSLAPSNTEILFALGLGDRIIGVTDYCDYPEEAKTKTRVAGYSTPDLEKLVSIQPDLVVAESIHEKTVLPALERLGFTVYVASAYRIETILNDISVLGRITGKTTQANKLIAGMNLKINSVVDRTAVLPASQRQRVLYLTWNNPMWTMGANTYINDIIKKAGGVNIYEADFEKSRAVSLESIITKNPQVIFVSGMGTTGDVVYKAVKDEVRLYSVEAVANNRIFKINDANLIERPGPRVADGLVEVAKLVHPEIFGGLK
jgi:iron complex transport system substrate-binding protein